MVYFTRLNFNMSSSNASTADLHAIITEWVSEVKQQGKVELLKELIGVWNENPERTGHPQKCFELPKEVRLGEVERVIWEGFNKAFLKKEKENINFKEELKKSLVENLEILETETNEMFEDLDVIFEIPIPNSKSKEVKEYHGIRALFAIHSEVFRAMFYGKMIESQKNTRVRLDDITPEAFKYILRLFYGMKPLINDYCQAEGFLESLLYTSKKYLLKELQVLCENISSRNKEPPEKEKPQFENFAVVDE